MISQVRKIISGNFTFFLLTIIGSLVVYFITPGLATEVFSVFLSLLAKIAPILLFVFLLIFAFNLFVKPKTVTKYLGSEKGLTGWLVSIAGGIISMGAIYMWYPLLADLREKGMKDSLVVAFLYNRAIKIPLLPFLVHYFGLAFTIIMTVYMIIFSVINGFVVDKIINLKK